MLKRVLVALAFACAAAPQPFHAAAAIRYHFTFPEPEHHWMQVEASFPDVGDAPLELRISRSSPGRYSLHEFAKNVYDVHAFSTDGSEIPAERPDESGWLLRRHGSDVTVKYKVYGDRVDGTYLAIDTTHAHMNMPAVIMWAHGLDDRPATLAFDEPPGVQWTVATQLHPGGGAREFTAPNLQYLMDSPVEFGPVVMRQFSAGGRTFRFALHHTGTDAEFDGYLPNVEKIVQQEGAIYGEYPAYEPGYYTFLADYLPYASGDGMEHRNSTVMTSTRTIRADPFDLLDTVAHEFFHSWNVERIRPRSLEPFDFDRANPSGELWLAEGFTQYYGPLVLQRAGVVNLAATAQNFAYFVDAVTNSPARRLRSAEEMSEMAPFTDGARPIDPTNWSNTYISYYTFGGAIALALDLTLRDRSDSAVALDDYMRAMWRVHGKPGGSREGYVDRPYTLDEAEARLAEVSGDGSFAHEFFRRYVAGHDVADYARLLLRAGLVLRKRSPGRAWWGDVSVDAAGGTGHVAALVAPDAPAYAGGVDQDERVLQVDGERIASLDDINAVLRRHKPGDRVQVVVADRTGSQKTSTITLAEDPHVDIVPLESTGGSLTPAQRTFRARWLNPR